MKVVLTVLAIPALIGLWMLSAWWLMLGIGIAHRDWWPLMPAMSFHVALILVLFVGIPTLGFGASSRK